MERIQEEKVIVYILRIVGVLTIFIGLILVTQGMIQSLASKPIMIPERATVLGTMEELKENLNYLSVIEILANISIILWGGFFFVFAKPLGKFITR